jgi:hypothetical protein
MRVGANPDDMDLGLTGYVAGEPGIMVPPGEP